MYMLYLRSIVDIIGTDKYWTIIDSVVVLILTFVCLVVPIIVTCSNGIIIILRIVLRRMVCATRGSKRKIDANEKEIEETIEQIIKIYQTESHPTSDQHPTTSSNNVDGRWLEYQKGPLSSKLLEMKCLDLFERNMGELYKCSSWGLNMKQKKTEFQHPDSRFLILFSSNRRNILAFTHFRLELQPPTISSSSSDPIHVLYVYELQVDESVRRCGIGQQIMELLESIAFTQSNPIITKVVLTVFKSNTNAMKFYTTKMNYQIDITSPSRTHPHKKNDYEILYKNVHPNKRNKQKHTK